MRVSEPLQENAGAWLEPAWPQPVTFRRIDILADDDVDKDLIDPHHHRTPFDTLPTLLRDYRIEARGPDGTWRTVSRATDNRRRRQVHTLDEPVTAAAVRIVVEATNGAAPAHIVAARAYAEEHERGHQSPGHGGGRAHRPGSAGPARRARHRGERPRPGRPR
ncbi:hypothetical protein ACFWNT_06235 [Streptomyces sp. NPDC058409]|uniref:hypothetical protein n=1 Tax=Streptomyces sp. NPDC058409 TaxID=3346484 RepID=UPI0036483247